MYSKVTLGLQTGRAGPTVKMLTFVLNMTMLMLVLNRTMFILVLNRTTLFLKRLCLQLTTVQTEVVNQELFYKGRESKHLWICYILMLCIANNQVCHHSTETVHKHVWVKGRGCVPEIILIKHWEVLDFKPNLSVSVLADMMNVTYIQKRSASWKGE